MSEARPRPLRASDAIKFLDEVKRRVSAAKYSELLAILMAYQAKTIDTDAVARRAQAIFQGHPTLIDGFNVFLPEGSRIDMDTPCRAPEPRDSKL